MKVACLLLVTAVSMPITIGSAQDAPTPGYAHVGVAKCKTCHSKESVAGTHYNVWQEHAHAKSFETLGSAKARESAAKHGIEDPRKDERCLICHTVKSVLEPTDKITHEEGVSCEACHGAAEKYFRSHRKVGLDGAVKLGMVPLRTMETEEKEKVCLGCHKEDPFHDFHEEFVYGDFWCKICHSKATSPQILEKRK